MIESNGRKLWTNKIIGILSLTDSRCQGDFSLVHFEILEYLLVGNGLDGAYGREKVKSKNEGFDRFTGSILYGVCFTKKATRK